MITAIFLYCLIITDVRKQKYKKKSITKYWCTCKNFIKSMGISIFLYSSTDQNFFCKFYTIGFHAEINKNIVKSLNTDNMIIKRLRKFPKKIEEKNIVIDSKNTSNYWSKRSRHMRFWHTKTYRGGGMGVGVRPHPPWLLGLKFKWIQHLWK